MAEKITINISHKEFYGHVLDQEQEGLRAIEQALTDPGIDIDDEMHEILQGAKALIEEQIEELEQLIEGA